MTEPLFSVCWKPVELRAAVDPLTGSLQRDEHSLGVSAADEAALEWALRCAERWHGRVRVVAAAPSEQASVVLRAALAAGASEAVSVEADATWPSDHVARCLASQLVGSELVWCGDASWDRGSGAVPSYLARELGMGQALGVVGISLGGAATAGDTRHGVSLEALRRLDGGRREQLHVAPRAVVSCEGGTARLRRASLAGVMSARETVLHHVGGPAPSGPSPAVVSVSPFRARARVVPAPAGAHALERIRQLTGVGTTGSSRSAARAVHLDPEAAAQAILDALADWGELPAAISGGDGDD